MQCITQSLHSLTLQNHGMQSNQKHNGEFEIQDLHKDHHICRSHGCCESRSKNHCSVKIRCTKKLEKRLDANDSQMNPKVAISKENNTHPLVERSASVGVSTSAGGISVVGSVGGGVETTSTKVVGDIVTFPPTTGVAPMVGEGLGAPVGASVSAMVVT